MPKRLTIRERAWAWAKRRFGADPDHLDYTSEDVRSAYRSGWLAAKRDDAALLVTAINAVGDADLPRYEHISQPYGTPVLVDLGILRHLRDVAHGLV